MNWSLLLSHFFLHIVLQSLNIKLHPSLEPSLLSSPLPTLLLATAFFSFLDEVTNSILEVLDCAGVEVVLVLLLPTLGLHFLHPNQGALVVIQESV